MLRPARAGLVRRLGAFDVALIVVGSVIGSGIFRTPSVVAHRAPMPADHRRRMDRRRHRLALRRLRIGRACGPASRRVRSLRAAPRRVSSRRRLCVRMGRVVGAALRRTRGRGDIVLRILRRADRSLASGEPCCRDHARSARRAQLVRRAQGATTQNVLTLLKLVPLFALIVAAFVVHPSSQPQTPPLGTAALGPLAATERLRGRDDSRALRVYRRAGREFRHGGNERRGARACRWDSRSE